MIKYRKAHPLRANHTHNQVVCDHPILLGQAIELRENKLFEEGLIFFLDICKTLRYKL